MGFEPKTLAIYNKHGYTITLAEEYKRVYLFFFSHPKQAADGESADGSDFGSSAFLFIFDFLSDQ